jgi:hypothetical protein
MLLRTEGFGAVVSPRIVAAGGYFEVIHWRFAFVLDGYHLGVARGSYVTAREIER